MTKKNRVTENYLKMLRFESPDWIPAQISLPPAAWFHYGQSLEELVLSHPTLFPNYRQGDYQTIELTRGYQLGRWVDLYGTVWENVEEGLDSNPVEELAPLRDWDDWDSLEWPDPLKVYRYNDAIDWEGRRAAVEKTKAEGNLASGKIWHGAMYMRLYYLRGFEGFMIDVATKDPRLDKLIDKVLDFNLRLIQKWIEIGIEIFGFADDLGFQTSLPMSPKDWRHYLKPCFAQMFGLCRDHDVYVGLHTDGYILDIIPDLIDSGLQLLNPQVRPNTLESLAKYCKGKIAVKLDLDRQMFPFATPQQVRDHIHEAVDTLALPEGGLMLFAECSRDVPLENVEMVLATLEDLGCRSYPVG